MLIFAVLLKINSKISNNIIPQIQKKCKFSTTGGRIYPQTTIYCGKGHRAYNIYFQSRNYLIIYMFGRFFLFFHLLPLFKPKNKQKSDFFACLSQIFQFAAVLNKISFCILFQQVIHIIHNSPYYPHLDGAALACAQRRQAKIPLKPKAAKKAGEKRLLYAL